MPVIVTAGHVDHGKSSLVRALTGTDPDRLAEEQRRGMTIELGFAHTEHQGTTLSFVDAPGHADLVRTMIAGASAVGTALLVVDAREGWMPQTHEHLGILELLGVSHGVVALTKRDLVDAERLDDVRRNTAEILATSSITWGETIPVSVTSGDGLGDLLTALVDAVSSARSAHDTTHDPSHDPVTRVRMFVDRVFTIAGAGTVVTGTLEGSSLAAGDTVSVSRSGRIARVRSIETHGAPVNSGVAGTRCAINLSDMSTDDVRRGDAIVTAEAWHTTGVFDAALTLARGAGELPEAGGGHLVHLGTDRQSCTLRPLSIPGRYRIRVESPWPMTPGDRFVVRRSGDSSTVAGGVVLDVAPVRRISRSQPDGSVESQLVDHGWTDVDKARRLTGKNLAPAAGRWSAAPSIVEQTAAALGAFLDAGDVRLDRLQPWERDLIETLADVVISGGVARRAGTAGIAEHPLAHDIKSWGVTGPGTATHDRDTVRRLVAEGVVFEHDGMAFHRDVLDGVAADVAALLVAHPGGFTVSALRERLGITRKHAVPLAECLDRAGYTVRRGDVRTAGPRLRPATRPELH